MSPLLLGGWPPDLRTHGDPKDWKRRILFKSLPGKVHPNPGPTTKAPTPFSCVVSLLIQDVRQGRDREGPHKGQWTEEG